MPGQLVFLPDKANPAKSAVYDLTNPVLKALKDFIDSVQVQTGVDAQGKPVFTSKYKGVADLMFTNLADGLFATVLERFPPANITTAQADIATAQATLEARRAAHIGKVSPVDPV